MTNNNGLVIIKKEVKDMNSLQVTCFLKVAECMSFSQAAAELYVSQPAVSRQIRLLEEELGCLLFDRSRKRLLCLTPAGMVFRDAFLRSQQGLAQAAAAAQQLAGQNELRLCVGIGQGWELSDMLLAFRRQVSLRHPRAALSFESCTFRQLHSKLHSGALDVILCTKTSISSFEALEIVEAACLESRAYVRRGLLRDPEEPLRIQDFQGQTLLMLPEDESPMAAQIVQLQFLAHQVETRAVYLPNRDTIFQALLMGDGISVFDEYMGLDRDPRLDWCYLDEMIPICTVWKRSNQNPLIRLFAEVMLQGFQARKAAPYP